MGSNHSPQEVLVTYLYRAFTHRAAVAAMSASSLALACLLLLVVSAGPALAQGSAGDLVGHQDLGVYSRERLNRILAEEIKQFSSAPRARPYEPALNGARLYRVRYVTLHPHQHHRPIVVTGLVALPDVTGARLPVLSYQHGTECSKHWVPSSPEESLETRLVVAAFAGQGYAVFLPDYIGKGGSEEAHPFFQAESEATASRDLIQAGRTMCGRLGVALKPDLFLSGWSQGGHATMALLRLLESEGHEAVKAAAPIAAPYDLYVTWEYWSTRGTSPMLPLLTAYLLQAYEREPGLEGLCRQAMKPPCDTRAHQLFDRDLPAAELFKNMPPRVHDLLRDDFVRLGRSGAHPFFQALRQNQAYSWRVSTPLRLYYGEADDVIPPELAEMAFAAQKAMGADVTLVSAGKQAGHMETFLWTLLEGRKWFDTFK